MTNYKIKINEIIRQLDVDEQSDVAICAWVDVIATDQRGRTAIETVEVSFGTPTSDTFTDYKNLTESQVTEWVQQALENQKHLDSDQTRMEHIKQSLHNTLQGIELVSGLPWKD